MKTAVLIPCYNEAKTIGRVVGGFQGKNASCGYLCVCNNSTDNTAELAEQAGAIVRYEHKQGKGNVVRTMFREVDADCYVMVDGDDTYPADFGPRLEQLVLSGKADMAVGDRLSSTYFTENKRPFHNFGNVLVRRMINFLFRAKLNDIMTGARAFSKDFVKSFPVISKGFEIETEMTIFALDNNFAIKEVPIAYQDRPQGSESKLNTYSDGLKVLKTIVNLFKDTKPLAFFSILSLILLLISFGFFLPILIQFVQTGIVDKFPTLIVISALTVIALLNFFCGVILSVLKKQHRQNFERQLTVLHELARLKQEDAH